MNANKKERFKEFFKKEGFYVVLFLCLCVIAVVATIATSQNKQAQSDTENEFNLNITDNQVSKDDLDDYQNANNTNTQSSDKANDKAVNTEENEETAQTSANVEQMYLYDPVVGTLSCGYQEPILLFEDTYKTNSSIRIKVEEGSEIKAAGDGIVEEVVTDSGEKGAYVKIKHTDGRTTIYSNLDPEVPVKKGDKVDKTTTIGKAGASSKQYSNTIYKNDLEFELYRANGEVMDPTDIFTSYVKETEN